MKPEVKKISFLIGKNLFYKRDVCTGDPRAHLQFHEGVHVDHIHIIERGRSVSVRIGFEGGGVYYSFVKDQSVSLCARTYVDVFGVRIPHEEIRVDDIDVAAFVLRVPDLVEEIVTHDVIVELSTSSNIEREPTNFAARFSSVGDVTVILGAR